MMPAFKQRYKKLHSNQKTPVNDAIEVIKANPLAGIQKKGDLTWYPAEITTKIGVSFVALLR
jgi:hypothetical protein